MIIYPAIDLKDGQCVRLVQGKAENKTVYSDAPGQIARSFQEQGAQWLHVVDLDGAFTGSPSNMKAISDIASSIDIPFQVGGGLRTRADVERILQLGAARVIIGTQAAASPDFVRELLDEFGASKIVLGLDARDGMVAVRGWVENSGLPALEFGQKMKDLGFETAIFTDVSRDGLLGGPNLNSTADLARTSGLKVIASGGVSSIANIKALKQLEPSGVCGAIIGKAIYDGKLTLAEALAAANS
ncbi:MAG: 1-(5-phosphoribosyl)-5-[(5-phosphoribosylamino)methylideneamino]imidazole-4-carboxamide isomerase [Syntrophomonadaceae bacterium]|jgi:phosphoribosylformimino-5-aminoimidazole carboxamide ribotide isomerase